MRVILRETVPHVGRSGELVTVREGYGRNYLIPQGLALAATESNVKHIEHQKRVISSRQIQRKEQAQGLATRLSQAEVVLLRQVGVGNKLFGSVVSRDIEQALQSQGLVLERKSVVLPEPIRTLGIHSVEIKLGEGVVANVKVRVEPRPE